VDIIDKRRAEVVVEVEILEVNRSRLQDYASRSRRVSQASAA